jgi:hypothetical protein
MAAHFIKEADFTPSQSGISLEASGALSSAFVMEV